MPISPRIRQNPADIVSLEGWELDQEFPFGPQGAKPKRIFICPSPPPNSFLIGGHRYLFKEPTGARAMQIWSEVIAYEVAREVGVPVPPAFLAYGPGNGAPGVLVEFFYGHLGDPDSRLIDGIERLQALRRQTDFHRGSLKDNIDVCRLQMVPDWRFWWARTLVFDALIGNTDRHSQNWGFLTMPGLDGRLAFSMAPAFDNGTSLGFIIGESDLDRFTQAERLRKFVHNGRHHCGWTSGDHRSAQHIELCRLYGQHISSTRVPMRRVLELSDAQIDEIVSWCRRFDFAVPFTEARAKFIAAQLRERREALAKAVAE
jgi:hypothetical protein